MNLKRAIGLSLILASGILSWSNLIFTGAVIGVSSSLSWIVVLMFIVGIVLIITSKTLDKVTEEAHNAGLHEKQIARLKFMDSHGAYPEDNKAYIMRYHAYPSKWKPDFSHGLDRTKAPSGFYFAETKSDALDEMESKGFDKRELDVVEVRISKNVYRQGKRNTRDIIQDSGAIYKGSYEYIPASKYKKANKLISKGLIRIKS